MNYKYLHDSVHHIIFNFSRKDLERFSELILELKGLLPGFSIAYLGENRGISRTLDIMKKVPGLSYSSMKLEYDPEKIGGIMRYKWIRKIRYNTPHSVTDAFYKFEDNMMHCILQILIIHHYRWYGQKLLIVLNGWNS